MYAPQGCEHIRGAMKGVIQEKKDTQKPSQPYGIKEWIIKNVNLASNFAGE